MLEIDIFWFSQYSAMEPLEAILTPKRSQTQAETYFKVFLVWFYIGPQSIMRAEVGRDTFSDLDDTLLSIQGQDFWKSCIIAMWRHRTFKLNLVSLIQIYYDSIHI